MSANDTIENQSAGHAASHAESAGVSHNAAPVAALQTEVMTAVRGAISTVMAGQGKSLDLAGIDLDFAHAPSIQLPVLRAKADQALAIPLAAPLPKAASNSRYAIAATVTLSVALGAAAATVWLQGLPESGQQASPVVAASAKAVPASLEPTQIVFPTPVPEEIPQPKLTPVLATVPAPAKLPAMPAPASDLATRAKDLLENGKVQDARKLLLGATDADSTEIAWVLARSFDANYLGTLGKPDAVADSAEARRWYELWFERSKKQGLVDKTVRLDRLLQSLR
jgi:hypothetical protein